MRILLLPLLVCVAGCGVAEPLAPGRYVQKISVGGLEREYRVTIPSAARDGKPLPLVVGFHGWTGSAPVFEIQTGFPALAEKEGFVFVAGQGLGSPAGWNVGWIDLSGKGQDEVAYLEAILGDIAKKAPVDPDRIYVCGHSNGGFLTWLASTKLGTRLAAVGVVAGAMGLQLADGTRRLIPEPTAGLPSALFIHGDADPVVAYRNGDKATLNRVVSQEDAFRWYAERAGTGPSVKREEPGKQILESAKDGKTVRLLAVRGGNHDWFGGFTREGKESRSGVDSTQLLWEFFRSHRRVAQ